MIIPAARPPAAGLAPHRGAHGPDACAARGRAAHAVPDGRPVPAGAGATALDVDGRLLATAERLAELRDRVLAGDEDPTGGGGTAAALDAYDKVAADTLGHPLRQPPCSPA